MPICDEEGKKEAIENWEKPCESNPNQAQFTDPPVIDWGRK